MRPMVATTYVGQYKLLSPLKSTLIERALPINRGLNYIQREYWIAREIIVFVSKLMVQDYELDCNVNSRSFYCFFDRSKLFWNEKN